MIAVLFKTRPRATVGEARSQAEGVGAKAMVRAMEFARRRWWWDGWLLVGGWKDWIWGGLRFSCGRLLNRCGAKIGDLADKTIKKKKRPPKKKKVLGHVTFLPVFAVGSAEGPIRNNRAHYGIQCNYYYKHH